MYQIVVLFFLGLFATPSEGFSRFLVTAEDQEMDVIPNPHGKVSCLGSLAGLLEPAYLMTKPMLTQADTFQDLTYIKVMDVPVPIYTMQQPARISSAELMFQLVLVRELSSMSGGAGKSSSSSSGIREVPWPMDKAKDSWFPGYYWTPLVMPCDDTTSTTSTSSSGGTGSCQDSWQHVGWKFTSTALGEDASRPSHFYALMVELEKKEKVQGLRIGGFKAPGWMVARIVT